MQTQQLDCIPFGDGFIPVEDASPELFFPRQTVHSGHFYRCGETYQPSANTRVTYMRECVLRDLTGRHKPGHGDMRDFVDVEDVGDVSNHETVFVGYFLPTGEGKPYPFRNSATVPTYHKGTVVTRKPGTTGNHRRALRVS